MGVRQRVLGLVAIEGFTVALALVGVVVGFSLGSPYFLTAQNVRDLLVQSIPILLTSLGMTFVLIAGSIDLSVGSTLGLSAGTTLLVLQHGAPLVAGIAAGLATGAVIGLVNGFAIAKLGISDFIVTLAMLGIAGGFLEVLTSHVNLTGVNSGSFSYIAGGSIGPIPFPVVLGLAFVVVLEFVLWRTSFGRSVFAVGINRRAAVLSGMYVTRLRLSVFLLSALLASAGGIVLVSRLDSVQPGLGSGYELTAIAAAVIGGTSIAGGRGSLWRTVVGTLLLGVLSNGLQILSVNSIWFTIISGLGIIVAVASDQAVQQFALSRLRAESDPARRTADARAWPVASGEKG